MSTTARKIVCRGLLVLVLLLAALAAAAVLIVPRQNDYQVDGTLHMKGIAAPVEIVRDAAGIPYVRAQNMDDLLFETRVRREVVLSTARELIDSFHGDRAKSADTRRQDRTDSRPLEDGRVH